MCSIVSELIKMAITAASAVQQQTLNAASHSAEKAIGEAQIANENLLNETNANAANALKGENNTLLAAKSALANMQRSGRNEATLKNAGSAHDAATTNILRVADANRAGSLERRIASAEQQGAVTADAAANGTGGSSARMLKQTLALTTARREVGIEGRQGQQTYDMLAKRAGIMSGAITGLDQGQTFAPLDRSKVIPGKVLSPMWQADYEPSTAMVILGALGGQLGAMAGNIGGGRSGGGKSSGGNASGSSDWSDWGKSGSSSNSGSDEWGAGSTNTSYGQGYSGDSGSADM